MEIKILDSRLADGGEWGIPSYATTGSAAMDLRACIDVSLEIWPGDSAKLISSGIALNMTMHDQIAAVLLPRSGMGHKHGLVLGNGLGLIDNDYQGEIKISAFNRNNPNSARDGIIKINPGDRIAQIMFIPYAVVKGMRVVQEFSDASNRGEGGFGSTGVKG